MKHYILLAALALFVACNNDDQNNEENATAAIPTPINLPYNIVKILPHDTAYFTQGLIWHNNALYEGTGLYGESHLMKMDISNGKATQKISLDSRYFGEGITILNDKIYQLTWEQKKVFVYDLATFKKTGEFDWPMEGWGITNNGKQLIVSTGSSNLYFVNPASFAIERTLGVYDNNGYVSNLNELEFVDGNIYANVWNDDRIIKINPTSGIVEARIDLTGILLKTNQPIFGNKDVLNGIAYNPDTKTFYITGKKWPALYEIKLN